jgi:hypothetical protein
MDGELKQLHWSFRVDVVFDDLNNISIINYKLQLFDFLELTEY